MVLPGTEWQVPLIRKIKETGHRVVVVNPATDSPGFKFADAYLIADIFDREKVLRFAHEQHVSAVLSDECDIVMNWIAELGEIVGGKALDRSSAALFTDKYMMREFCKRHALPAPNCVKCSNPGEAVQLFKRENAPIIIKPLDSNSSHGVFVCRSEQQIIAHYKEAESFSRKSKNVLAESFIDGPEFTVDGIKTPAGHYTLAISQKKHFAYNKSIACELLFTHENDNYDYEALKAINDTFVMKSSLAFGLTHAEYKYKNGQFFLIEIAARGGGNRISSSICPFMSGHDTYSYLIDCALGKIKETDFSVLTHCRQRAALLKFFDIPVAEGRVTAIQGIEYLNSEPCIAEYKFNFKVGDAIREANSDSARIGYYIALCEDKEHLERIKKSVEEKVKIIIER